MTDHLPAPRTNLTAAGFRDRGTDVATGASVRFAVGDYTSGTPSEDMFTLASHGLKTGDVLHVLWQSVMGAITGGVGLRCLAKVASSSVFQVTTAAGVVIENTADGSVAFLKGNVSSSLVETGILPNLIVADGDFDGGAAADIFTSGTTGVAGVYEGDTLKLLFKAGAGVLTNKAVDATVYAKAPTVSYFQVAATSGGAVIENSADGVAVFLKTS
jgi:hypothetical protein